MLSDLTRSERSEFIKELAPELAGQLADMRQRHPWQSWISAITFIVSMATLVFVFGVSYAAVKQNTADIAEMKKEQQSMQAQLNTQSAHSDVIDSKLDDIRRQLTSIQTKLDQTR